MVKGSFIKLISDFTSLQMGAGARSAWPEQFSTAHACAPDVRDLPGRTAQALEFLLGIPASTLVRQAEQFAEMVDGEEPKKKRRK
jgi:hypothetical protein